MVEDIKYKFNFEQRTYNEDATAEEIQAIKSNVFIYNKNTICYKEMPIISPFSIKVAFDEIERLSEQMTKHGLLIDLRDSQKPNAPTRRAINARFSKICENVEHVAFCTGRNILINAAVRFVMYQTDLNSFSIHKTVAASVQVIKKKVNG